MTKKQALHKKPVTQVKAKAASKRVLLAGGNPQIAKGDGEAPVRAYIAAIPGWRREVARKVDAIVSRAVPRVIKAVKWNSPFYGVEGKGWFLSFHMYTKYVKVTFFNGASLLPLPPGESKNNSVRHLDIREDDELNDAQLTSWIKQSSTIPGWMP